MDCSVKRPIRLLSTDPKLREQTEYNSRRLAKLGIPAETVLSTLAERLSEAEVRDIAIVLNRCYSEVREAEARVLEELFHSELQSRTLCETLEGFAGALQRYAKADYVRFWFPYEVPSILKRPMSFERRDTDARVLEPRWKAITIWSVPLEMHGVLQLGFSKKYPWLLRERELLQIAAERSLAAAEKARLIEQLAASERQVRDLAARMLETEEMERRRISRELHDEAGQSLMFIRLSLEMLEREIADSPLLASRVRQTREQSQRAIQEIRRILSALNPEVLERLGLAAAIRQLGTRLRDASQSQVEFQIAELPVLPPKTELLVYRLAQEGVSNAAKHSQAKNVKVSLNVADGNLRLTIADNGIGFQQESGSFEPASFGIAGMRERVALLGGRIEIRSRPQSRKGHGTKIEIELPIGQKEHAANPHSAR